MAVFPTDRPTPSHARQLSTASSATDIQPVTKSVIRYSQRPTTLQQLLEREAQPFSGLETWPSPYCGSFCTTFVRLVVVRSLVLSSTINGEVTKGLPAYKQLSCQMRFEIFKRGKLLALLLLTCLAKVTRTRIAWKVFALKRRWEGGTRVSATPYTTWERIRHCVFTFANICHSFGVSFLFSTIWATTKVTREQMV